MPLPSDFLSQHPLAVDPAPPVTLRRHWQPGDVGYITYLHGALYAREQGWDHTFDAYVAEPLARFCLNYDPDREGIWIVERGGLVAGSIAIVAANSEQAQLRWFLLHPDLRGQGWGRRLIEEAVGFCRQRGYRSVFLWTVDALPTAAHLYRKAGFQVVEEKRSEVWGAVVNEQRYDLTFA